MKHRNMRDLIKIVALILAAVFCLQVASVVFAMEQGSDNRTWSQQNLPYSKNIECLSKETLAATLNQDRSKILIFDYKYMQAKRMPSVTQEIPFSGIVINDKSLAINNAGTKVAIATTKGIQVFDTTSGSLIHKYPSTTDVKKLNFVASNDFRPSYDEFLNIERDQDSLFYRLSRQAVSSSPSLLRKVLQHKITKIFGVCALGAGIVGCIGYLMWKFLNRAKENKENSVKKNAHKQLKGIGVNYENVKNNQFNLNNGIL
jgi:hypothetical protein